ncbi:MAG: hypothetical protein ACJAQT_001044 [Akkermansiaceae bacterium]
MEEKGVVAEEFNAHLSREEGAKVKQVGNFVGTIPLKKT